MKIAIICDPVDLNMKTGIPVYCSNLIKQIMKVDKSNQYVFFHMKENTLFDGYEQVILNSNSKYGILNAIYMLWKKFILIPYHLNRLNVDIVHELNMINPAIFTFRRKYKTVTTMFDLTPVVFSKMHSFLNVLGFKLFAKFSMKATDKVISISDATKNDIIKYLGTPESKITTTYLGTDVLERVEDNTLHFDFPFILSVGTLEPRKNLRMLVKAFIELKEKGLINEKLVLVGKKGWKINGLFDELNLNRNYENEVMLTGFISDEQLVHLYKTCKIFCYPSIYEGFGLPVLEAMSLGCAVITSNVSSLPEVAGDNAIMVNPSNIEQLKNALLNLINDDKLRTENIAYGLEQSKKFSWEKCAKDTIKVYEDLYNLA